MIKALHTSDWHLGAQLYEKDRLDEQRLFLRWLTETIQAEQIRLLVVSGDIFDSHVPPVPAQVLYYEFLADILRLETRPELVITAGNHDSPQFLNAPREILSHLRIHIVPGLDHNVLSIRDEQNKPALAVCAVPFLRERDLKVITDRAASGGGSSTGDDPAAKYREAAAAHYRATVEQARREMPDTPLLVTGHLFVSGSTLSDDASERLREVGRLSSLPAETLPPADYHALGHLHRPQAVKGNERCRYSGSPIPMSFGEAGQAKSVVIVEFRGPEPRITLKAIPSFSKLEQIRGGPEAIRKRLAEIEAADEEVCIDIQVTEGTENIHAFWDEINTFRAEAQKKHSRFSILAAQDMRKSAAGPAATETFTEVSSLEPVNVFERKLDEEQIEGTEREIYIALFKEIEAQVRSEEAAEAVDDNEG